MALKKAEREFRATMRQFDLKWCPGCAAFVSVYMFGKNAGKADGMRGRCLHCAAKSDVRRREDDPAVRARMADACRAWRAANRARTAEYAARYRSEHPEAKRSSERRRRARLRANGAIPYREADVWEAYNHTCIVCGAPGEHLDHWTAIANGGPDAITNAVILCAPCNRSKGAKDPLEFLASRGIRFDRVVHMCAE